MWLFKTRRKLEDEIAYLRKCNGELFDKANDFEICENSNRSWYHERHTSLMDKYRKLEQKNIKLKKEILGLEEKLYVFFELSRKRHEEGDNQCGD